MTQEIYIIDDDESSLPIFKELFRDDKEFKFIGVKTEEIDVALKNIPFLIIINEIRFLYKWKSLFCLTFQYVKQLSVKLCLHGKQLTVNSILPY